VGPQETVDLAPRHLEGDLAQGPNLAEVPGDRGRLDPQVAVPPILPAHPRLPFRATRETFAGTGAVAGSRWTVAAMPALSSGAGSIRTLTPKTWSLRWSGVWMFLGVYSPCWRISTTRPGNLRPGKVSTSTAAGCPMCTLPSCGSGT